MANCHSAVLNYALRFKTDIKRIQIFGTLSAVVKKLVLIFLERRFSKMQPNTKRTLQEDKTVTSFFHQAENQETSKWSLKNLILIFLS